MVLFTILNVTYWFLLVDFGSNGRISDGSVLQNTTFHERLNSNKLNIPKPSTISDSATKEVNFLEQGILWKMLLE